MVGIDISISLGFTTSQILSTRLQAESVLQLAVLLLFGALVAGLSTELTSVSKTVEPGETNKRLSSLRAVHKITQQQACRRQRDNRYLLTFQPRLGRLTCSTFEDVW